MTATPSPVAEDPTAALEAVVHLPAAERATALEPLWRHPAPSTRASALRVGAALLTDDCLVGLLRDGADDVRRNAGLQMLARKGRSVVPLAIALLNDRDADVVLQAVMLLDELRDPRALGPLRDMLRHSNGNVVHAAICALGHLGHRAAAEGVLPLLDGGFWVQAPAIEALGDLRAEAAVEPLAHLLGDPMVGALAADALGRIGSARAFRVLAERWLETATYDTADLERLAVVLDDLPGRPSDIDGLYSALVATLRHGPRDARASAARCVLALGPGAGDHEAIETLARRAARDGSIPQCLRTRPDLMGTLLNGSGQQRTWGLRLAAYHPERVRVHDLSAAVAASPECDHGAELADALYAVGHPFLAADVVALYRRLSPDERLGWGPLLGRYRAAIRSVLEDRSPLVDEADRVLDSVVVASPYEAADRIAALPVPARLVAIAHVSERPEVLPLLPWIEWLSEAPEVYGSHAARIAERAGLATRLPELRDLLRRTPHPDLVRILGALRDEDAVPLLRDLVEQGADDVVPFALTALGRIGSDAARDVLRAAATVASRARFAVRALAECRAPADLEVFRRGARHTDWHVRMTCATVLSMDRQVADEPLLALLGADPVAAVSGRARGTFGR